MKGFIERINSKGETVKCNGSLHISNRRFTIYFAETTPNIGLNDGNFHCLNELSGEITNLFVDNHCLMLEGCFVKIGDKWHKDGFNFYFR